MTCIHINGKVEENINFPSCTMGFLMECLLQIARKTASVAAKVAKVATKVPGVDPKIAAVVDGVADVVETQADMDPNASTEDRAIKGASKC